MPGLLARAVLQWQGIKHTSLACPGVDLSSSLQLLGHGLAHHTAIVLPAGSMNIGFWSGREIKGEYSRHVVEVYAPGHT